MSLYSQTQTYSSCINIQVSENILPFEQNLICLSLDKSNIYLLNEGIIPNLKLLTDSIFKGISKLWVIKRHHQDLCHEYLIMSSENSTYAFKLEEYTLVDVTNILNIDRNASSKIAFNLKNSSYFVCVTANNILMLDLSKVDSVDGKIVKFEYSNTEGEWEMAYHFENYLFCFSQKAKTIEVFQLKSRTRDINLVFSLGKIDIAKFEWFGQELTAFIGRASESEFELVLSSVSGYLLHFTTDLSLNVKMKHIVNMGETVESIAAIEPGSLLELYIGTRYGALMHVNFKNLSFLIVDQVGNSPVKLMKLLNDTLMSYCHNSSILIRHDSKEFMKRRLVDWGCETAIELVYGLGKTYIAGIKDDSLILMTVPLVSENTMSKRVLFYDSKFNAFLAMKTCKWLIGCTDINAKKSYLKAFDFYGIETNSIDWGSEIIDILSIDSNHDYVIVVSVTRDKLQSKMEIVDVESTRLETRSEYVFEGLINKTKILGRYKSFITIFLHFT